MMNSIETINKNMDKESLNKLSRSELIDLLLKKGKKEPKIVIVDDTKPKPKTVKRKPIPKPHKSVKQMVSDYEEKNAKIKNYPMIEATLEQYRKEEMKMSADPKRNKKSFYELFKARKDNKKGERETVSITVYVLTDSFNLRTYKPFIVDIPKGLNTRDTYKFALYTLLTNIIFLSGVYIIKIGAKIIQLNKKHFKHHKMGGLKLESYLLNKQRPIKSHGVNTCVIDYVWD